MAKNKTQFTDEDVEKFIETFANNEQKKSDSFELIRIMQELTGESAKMWGPSIIGFGNYHYKYASGHEGDAPVLGFSPRKAAISLYVYSDTEVSKQLVTKLGKHKMAKACIYINKLSDVDTEVLKEICRESIRFISEHYTCSCHINK